MKPTPPLATKLAVLLLALSFLAGLVRIIIDGNLLKPSTAWLWLAAIAALMTLILYSLWKGLNWLRWLSVVSIALGMAALPWSLAEIGQNWQKSIYVAQGILQTAAVVLLFLPSSRRWFRPNNSFKPTPLRGAA